MKKYCLCFYVVMMVGCGNQSNNPKDTVPPEIPKSLHMETSDKSELKAEKVAALSQCPEKYATIMGGISRHSFYDAQNYPDLFVIPFSKYAFSENIFFNNDIRNLEFNEDQKCEQIELSLSGKIPHSQHLYLAMNKKRILEDLSTNGQTIINNLDLSYFSSSTESMPDNLALLPSHNFFITLNCPSGITVSCEFNNGKCDISKELNVLFPNDACTLKSTDQVFALYPKSKIRINFEGTILKTGKVVNGLDEIEIKISKAEWK